MAQIGSRRQHRRPRRVKRLGHYSSAQTILVVGDGDLSFSLALATAFGSGHNLVATSLDSYDALTSKYGKAESNVTELERLGATVLHGVDAKTMKHHPCLKMRQFDRIVFNFPHAGFIGHENEDHMINAHQLLVRRFFCNANHLLCPDGEIHVSHKKGQYDKWKIEELAYEFSLVMFETVAFQKEDYPGYNQKRGDGKCCDQKFPLHKGWTSKFCVEYEEAQECAQIGYSTHNLVNQSSQTSQNKVVKQVWHPKSRSVEISESNKQEKNTSADTIKIGTKELEIKELGKGRIVIGNLTNSNGGIAVVQQGPFRLLPIPKESLCSALLEAGKSPCFSASAIPPMAGGGGGERKPATSSSSARQRKPRVSRDFGPERSSESQKEGPCSSSPSVSSKKSPLPMITPVLRKSLDSPVQPPKSLDSTLQTVVPVEPPKSRDSPVHMVASSQVSKPLDSRSASSGSGTVGSDSGAAPFDICMSNSKGTVKLNRGLLEINREKRRARELSISTPVKHLRPGMVLLKNFLKPDDQVKIIELCRDLGVGRGGFYQPGYREGAKLSLRMMCLGKNWDPDLSTYGDVRPIDGARPPKIPEELTKFVKDAIEASHEFLKQRGSRASNPPSELPLMSPDICVVNFYTSSGKLGLHRDKDEAKSSLDRGLPVVSFSLGDTAEFLYGDDRDEAKALKIKLESGDVLIFGGQSRHIFHGVSSIAAKTAPLCVTDKANLRPGRLNLTFRQYE